MHWSRELLALTAGVRWRIASLVAIGLLVYLWLLDPPVAVLMGVFPLLALLGPWLFRKATRHGSNWHWQAYASFAAVVLDSASRGCQH